MKRTETPAPMQLFLFALPSILFFVVFLQLKKSE